jgi:hypothetical protein
VARPLLVPKADYDASVPLGPEDPFPLHVEAFLYVLGTKKPSANTIDAYRRDLVGLGTRIAALKGSSVAELRVGELTKSSLRAGFASWATDHAEASLLRARSAWSGFFDYLVAEDLVEGNPMAAVGKPKLKRDTAKVLKGSDTARRLLDTASQKDPRARDPWPERDVALVATFWSRGSAWARRWPSPPSRSTVPRAPGGWGSWARAAWPAASPSTRPSSTTCASTWSPVASVSLAATRRRREPLCSSGGAVRR